MGYSMNQLRVSGIRGRVSHVYDSTLCVFISFFGAEIIEEKLIVNIQNVNIEQFPVSFGRSGQTGVISRICRSGSFKFKLFKGFGSDIVGDNVEGKSSQRIDMKLTQTCSETFGVNLRKVGTSPDPVPESNHFFQGKGWGRL
jgi:hypothetical protein